MIQLKGLPTAGVSPSIQPSCRCPAAACDSTSHRESSAAVNPRPAICVAPDKRDPCTREPGRRFGIEGRGGSIARWLCTVAFFISALAATAPAILPTRVVIPRLNVASVLAAPLTLHRTNLDQTGEPG